MTKSRVIVRLKGGLGNQMFQYAAARALALRLDSQLKLDVVSGFSYDRLYERAYRLGRFAIQGETATPEEAFAGTVGRIRRTIARTLSHWQPPEKRTYICESGGASIAAIGKVSTDKSLYLDGLWQSEDYFRSIRDVLLREFSPMEKLLAARREFNNTIRSSEESVSVHIRRFFILPGKSTPEPVSDESPIANLTRLPFYRAALELTSSTLKRATFFVFSDHPGWAKENLRFPGPVTYAPEGGPDSDILDLHSLSLCRHHVIAASTFSWWGAWLSTSAEKVIVAPKAGWPDPRAVPDKWQKV